MYKGKVIIYTAIFGAKDHPAIPQVRCKGVEYVMFTDSDFASKFWKVVKVPLKYCPRRTARYYKMIPHELFPRHGMSLWLDGKIWLRGNTSEWMQTYVQGYDCALKIHPNRTTAHEEAAYCAQWGYDDRNVIVKQMARYKADGFPAKFPLFWTDVLIRQNNPRVQKFNEMWKHEVINFSLRDQISFGYCAWKNELKISQMSIPFTEYYARQLEHATGGK